MGNKYLLGIVGTETYEIDTYRPYYQKVEISEDILNWLKMHDLEVDSKGNTIFKVNNIKYIYLGLNLDCNGE